MAARTAAEADDEADGEGFVFLEEVQRAQGCTGYLFLWRQRVTCCLFF